MPRVSARSITMVSRSMERRLTYLWVPTGQHLLLVYASLGWIDIPHFYSPLRLVFSRANILVSEVVLADWEL